MAIRFCDAAAAAAAAVLVLLCLLVVSFRPVLPEVQRARDEEAVFVCTCFKGKRRKSTHRPNC